MSLIMDALKKLERERETPGQSVVVVAAPAAGSVRRRFLLFFGAALAVCLLAGLSAWGVWKMLSAPPAPPSASTGAPAPATPRPAPSAAAALPSPIWETPPAPRPGASSAAVRAATPAPRALIAPDGAAPVPELRLEAVSSQDGQPVAVINGQLVREGDAVEGARVVKIAADHVELVVQGRRRVIGF